MQSVEYKKIDLKNQRDVVLDIDLEFLIDDFSKWMIEYITQSSQLITNN